VRGGLAIGRGDFHHCRLEGEIDALDDVGQVGDLILEVGRGRSGELGALRVRRESDGFGDPRDGRASRGGQDLGARRGGGMRIHGLRLGATQDAFDLLQELRLLAGGREGVGDRLSRLLGLGWCALVGGWLALESSMVLLGLESRRGRHRFLHLHSILVCRRGHEFRGGLQLERGGNPESARLTEELSDGCAAAVVAEEPELPAASASQQGAQEADLLQTQ